MKKRVLSVLLAIVMVVGLLPVTAGATAEPVKTWNIGAPESGTTTATDAVVAKLYTNAADNTKYDLVISGTGEMESTHGTSMPWTYDSTYQKHIVSVTVESGVTNVESYAFKDCTALTSVTIGDTVTEIGSFAFNGCTALTSVTLGASVTEIWGSAFGGCTSLTAYTVDSENTAYSATDGILFSKDGTTLVSYPSNKSGTSYTVPDSVTKISSSAFCDVINLTELTIPHTTTTIVGTIFYGKAFEGKITIKGHTGSAAETYTKGDTDSTTFVSICSDGDDADTLCDVCGYDTAHTHPVCGAAHSDIGDHTDTCEAVEWTAWDGTTNITYTNNIAYVYLTQDVALNSPLEITAGKTLNLCLNGHVLSQSAIASPVIQTYGAANLNICDCTSTTHAGYIDPTTNLWTKGTYDGSEGNVASVTLTGGVITGGKSSSSYSGGGICLSGTGTMNLYGGNVAGNSSTYFMGGGGIGGASKNTINIYGGSVTGNNASGSGSDPINNSGYGGGGIRSNSGTLNLYAGSIAYNTTNGNGGGLCLVDTTCVLAGGSISHNTAFNGGGVKVLRGTATLSGTAVESNSATSSSGGGGGIHAEGSGTGKITLTITGGSIAENTAATNGGGMYLDEYGTCTMSAGSISKNTAENSGGGVYVYGTSGSRNISMTMMGGSITENTADRNGGGVYVTGNATFSLSNLGEITNNSAQYRGGGIHIEESTSGTTTLNISGGTISENAVTNNTGSGGGVYYFDGTVNLSGAPTITGNKVDVQPNNLFISENSQVTISGELANSEKIGVTMYQGTGTFAQPDGSTVISLATGYKDYFFSDDNAYTVVVDGVNLKLAAAFTVSFNANGGSGTMDAVSVVQGGTYTLPSCTFTPPTGKQFKGWAQTEDGAVISGTTIPVSVDTTLYAVWEDAPAHSHDMSVACGNDDPMTFTAWNGTGTPSGNVYLTDDVTLTETLTISSGTVNLCLNGHSITNNSAAIEVKSGATLNICDCSTEESGTVCATASGSQCIYNYGTVNVYGGTVSGNTYGICNNYGGNVAVSGGTVSGGTGIENYGTLTVSGGSVKGTHTYGGYGISTYGTFKLSGAPAITGGSNSADVLIHAYQKVITIDGTLTYSTPISVKPNNGYSAFTNGWNDKMPTADHNDYFIPASGSYVFVESSDELKPAYTVTYDANGAASGSVPVDSSSPYFYSNVVTVLDNTGGLAKEGYEFSGWNTKADGTGTHYAPDSTFTIDSNTTLYAVWKVPHIHEYTYAVNTENAAQVIESCTCGHEETATVSGPTGTIVYDGTEKKGATVSYSTGWLGGTLTVTYQNNINAGQATASITKNGATASVNFTIDKAASGNTLPTGLTATYGETLADVILPAGWTWNTPSQSVGDVGQKTFAAVYTPTNSNYKTVEADLMVTVGKATLTPENFLVLLSEDWSVALPASVTYNGNRRGVTVNRAPDGYTNSGTITVKYYDSNGTLLTSSPRDVGTYTIKLDITEGRCYKAATDLTSPDWTLTIGLASATLTPPTANDLTYNGGDQSLVSVGTAIGGELEYALGTDDTTAPVTGWSGALPQGQNAGTYYIWYKVVGDDNHNDIAPACVAVTIAKKQITKPAADSSTFTYNGNYQTYALNGDPAFIINNNVQKNAGSYTVTVTLKDTANYAWADGSTDNLTFTFTIAPKAVTVTADAKSMVYGAAEPTLTYVAEGLIDGQSLVGTLTRAAGNNAGTYEITQGTVTNANNPNYAITFVRANFVISKANQDAPVVGKVDETIFNKNDGKITDVTNAMEYRKNGTDTYTDIVGVEIAGLADGTYYVRYAETENRLASDVVTVVIAAGKKVTVTFAVNGGNAIEAIKDLAYGDKVTAPTEPKKSGYYFAGWFSDEKCTKLWVFDKDTITGDMTLYAKWSEVTVFQISGTVKQLTGNSNETTAVIGATVKLMLGDKEIATTTTEENGSYSFAKQPTGTYNVVASKDGKIVTVLVELRDNKTCNIKLPESITNSIVEHKTSEGFTAGTLVGGLEDVAAAVRDKNQSADKVEVKLTVKDTPPVTGTPVAGSDAAKQQAQQKAIQQKAGGKQLVFFDLSVVKTINGGAPEAITDTGATLLEIRIPFDSGNKWGITIYRYHDNKAEALAAVNEGSQTEGFWVGDDGYIHIYTHRFSTYAVGYTVPSYGYFVPVTPDTVTSADTFDAGIVVYVTMSMLAATGSAVVIGKKRKEN